MLDELAHTNAPGSRHAKRWQDVEELLGPASTSTPRSTSSTSRASTTSWRGSPRIRVRETVPDRVLERADEIELVDLPPEELIEPPAGGQGLRPDQATRAVENFFQPGNLMALRELALRRTAERVDDQMVDYMREHAIAGPVAGGRAHPGLRQRRAGGARPGARRPRAWPTCCARAGTPSTSRSPQHQRLDEGARQRIADALRLAEHLGAEAVILPGRDLPAELLQFAAGRNITQIVLGKSRRSRWRQLLGRSLVNEVTRRSQGVAIHVITGRDEAEAATTPPRPRRLADAGAPALSVERRHRRGRRGAWPSSPSHRLRRCPTCR